MATELGIEWKWGMLAALAMSLIALYPQVSLWVARGDQWQGSYVLTQGDEVNYSAYIDALIDGQQRLNDPFTGQRSMPGKPASETAFSIQFVPAYAIALPARALGLSTSTVFIWLIVIVAISSSLAIFGLIATLSGDSKLAAVGVLLTLCFGTLVGSDCCWRANAFTEMLPFLRRYQPSFVFPLFFVFCFLVWRALTRESQRARLVYSLAAGALFSILVFSYFFIWTAALAWFVCAGLLWILFRRDQAARVALTSSVIGAFAIATIIPFSLMLLQRNSNMDQSLLLESTHAPDFLNQPQVIGFSVMGVIGYAFWRKLVDIHCPLVLFTMSFAMMPFVVFNQQVLTGKSLQPIHYRVFIANYVVLLSVVLLFLILWRARYQQRPIASSVLALATIVALGLGLFEVSAFARRGASMARLRDDILGVADRMNAIANEEGIIQPALAGEAPFPTVFTSTVDSTLEVSMAIPSDSPMAVLWSLHADAVGISIAESKERFYRHLYYCGLTPKEVAAGMREKEFWVLAPLFGTERVTAGLVSNPKPITVHDIIEERRRYADFYNSFTRKQAADPVLSFAVVSNGQTQPNFANLDRWYQRDGGQTVGAFTIYRVKLRP